MAIPPNSAGYDPEIVPELQRTYRLTLWVLGVAGATLMVGIAALIAARNPRRDVSTFHLLACWQVFCHYSNSFSNKRSDPSGGSCGVP